MEDSKHLYFVPVVALKREELVEKIKWKGFNCCRTASECISVAVSLDTETSYSRLLCGKECKTWLAITLFLFLQTRVHLMGPNQVGRFFVIL